jgi:hypothetical protein
MTAPLDFLPLWGLFLATVSLCYLGVEGGYWLGNYRRRSTEVEKESTVGPIVGASLGLLAFMLAFTFGLAASRFDARRQMVVEEANAIGTAHLRAGLLPEPHRREVRDLLRQYLDVRIEAVRSGKVEYAMTESPALHNRLWSHAEALAKEDPHSIAAGLFIQSLNEMIDLHSKRVLIGLRNRIPAIVWGSLYFVSILAMAEIGYNSGLASSRRSLAAGALVVTFSIVMMLILDLDRPQEGLMRVSQEAMLDLQKSLASFADRSESQTGIK